MKFLLFLICLVYSLPTKTPVRAVRDFFADVVQGQENTRMYLASNFKLGNRKFNFWLPENLYKKSVLKQPIPHDPAIAITGFPSKRRVEFTAHLLDEKHGKFEFISQEIDLKNYKLNSESKFEKDDLQKFKTRIKLVGYLKGSNNIIITERASFHHEMPEGDSALFTKYSLLDLEPIKRYPDRIPRLSYEGKAFGSDAVRYYAIVPPPKFWQHPMLFEVVPTSGFTIINSRTDLGNGLHNLEAELRLQTGDEIKQVKFRFVVSHDEDHIAIKSIGKISYPSDAAARFRRDDSTPRSTAVLEEATAFLNKEVFNIEPPVVGIPISPKPPINVAEKPPAPPIAPVDPPVVPKENIIPSTPPLDSVAAPVDSSAAGPSGLSRVDSKPLIELSNSPKISGVDLIGMEELEKDPFPTLDLTQSSLSSSKMDRNMVRSGSSPLFEHVPSQDLLKSGPSTKLERTTSSKIFDEKLTRTSSAPLLGQGGPADVKALKNAKILADLDSLVPFLEHPGSIIVPEKPLEPAVDLPKEVVGLVTALPKRQTSGESKLSIAGVRQENLKELNPFAETSELSPLGNPAGLGNPFADAAARSTPLEQKNPAGLGVKGTDNLKKAGLGTSTTDKLKDAGVADTTFADLVDLKKPEPPKKSNPMKPAVKDD